MLSCCTGASIAWNGPERKEGWYAVTPKICFADASAYAQPARFFEAYAAVPAARREKVDRLRSPAAKQLSLAAGDLLRQALADAGVAPEDAEPAEGAYGKPWLPRRPDVCFSLSHSGTRVMCAVADRPVGCDVQETSPRDLRIARRFFSEEEQRVSFSQAAESARQAVCFRIWALKESFLKCIGLGLALPLDAFTLYPGDGGIVLRQSHDAARYSFFMPDTGEGYCSACCVRE